jgi:hypothetical protein
MEKHQQMRKVFRALLVCYRQGEMPTDDCLDEIFNIIKQGGMRKVRDSKLNNYEPTKAMQDFLTN